MIALFFAFYLKMSMLNMPDVIQTDASVDSYNKSKLSALHFTKQILASNPSLLGDNIQCLLYALYGGMEYNIKQVLQSIQSFIGISNSKYMQNKEINTFAADSSFIIQYAKSLQLCENIANFEPCFEDLIDALKTWCTSSIITYNGKQYDAKFFKPLCYNMSGDNIFKLIPYIAYVMTFLVNCSPFKFMSSDYEVQGFTFLVHLNDHLMKGYQNLATDLNINIQTKGLSALSNIKDQYFIDLFKAILSPDAIRGVRDHYLRQSEDLLEVCIQHQHALTKEYIREAYYANIDRIFMLVVEHNPIAKMLKQLPMWTSDMNINNHELALWTEYALAGGDKPLTIIDDTSALICYASNDYNFKLPEIIAKEPKVITNVDPISTYIKGQPFSCNDIILRLISSKISHEFVNAQTDILSNNQIKFNEAILQYYFTKITNDLISLYTYGIYSKYGASGINMFNTLLVNPITRDELVDILALPDILQKIYENDVANAIAVPFILGMLDKWVTAWCDQSKPMNTFSIYTHLILENLKRHTREYNKLADMVVSLSLLTDVHYSKFVNTFVKNIIPELTVTNYVFMPYVKGLADAADLYAIGGCELYNYAKISNPYIRAYAWYINNFGVTADAYSVYKYSQTFINNDLLELINEYKNNELELISILRVQLNKLIASRKMPSMLSNYNFTAQGYGLKNVDEVIVNPMFKELTKYMFPKSLPAQATDKVLLFRQIHTNSLRKVRAGNITANSIVVDNTKLPVHIDQSSTPVALPVYDLTGSISYTPVSMITPGGYHLEWVKLYGNKINENNVVLLVCNHQQKTRYQKYEYNSEPTVRMTKLKNAAIVKRQNEMITPQVQTAIKLARDGLN